MISFFPDLNVWLALSVGRHIHREVAWTWMEKLPSDARLVFSRYTHVGFLRLLTNASAMGEQTLTLREAWASYDSWLLDPRVEFYPEPRELDSVFRAVTEPFWGKSTPNAVGDCYLLAYAEASGSTLVTFDQALLAFAQRQGYAAITPL